jgi:hypothetical protein
LRRHRLAAGLSQKGLAELARMSAVGIGALERSDRLVALLRRESAPSEPAHHAAKGAAYSPEAAIALAIEER